MWTAIAEKWSIGFVKHLWIVPDNRRMIDLALLSIIGRQLQGAAPTQRERPELPRQICINLNDPQWAVRREDHA